MGWDGIDLFSPFEQGLLYRARLAYQGKDAQKVSRACGELVRKWNGKYRARWSASTARIRDGLIAVEGYGTLKPESFGTIKLDKFFAAHMHIEGVNYFDAAVASEAGGGGPAVPRGQPPVAIPPGGEPPPGFPSPPAGGLSGATLYLVIGGAGILLLVVGFMLFRGRGKGKRSNPGNPGNCGPEECPAAAEV